MSAQGRPKRELLPLGREARSAKGAPESAPDRRDLPRSLRFRNPAAVAAPFAAWGSTASGETFHASIRARASCLFRMLTWSLAGILVSFALVIGLAHLDEPNAIPALQAAALSVLATSGLAYYVVLGMLADHLGRNWILWVGLTLVTKPVGPFIAYLMMRDRVKYSPRPFLGTSQHCIRCGTLVTAGARLCSACGNPTTAGIAESLRVDAPAMNLGADLHTRRSSVTAGWTRN
jgi:hypothetical protein